MAGEIGVKDREMIVESKGLHLYGYAEDFKNARTPGWAERCSARGKGEQPETQSE